jgi:homoserine O-acetyltransferase
MKPKIFRSVIELECSGEEFEIEIAYHSSGNLGDNCSKVVWVCHALTANSNVLEWWPGLFGPGCLFNPNEYLIICANTIGSCYGSTGPLSNNPETNRPYFHDFPELTIRDMVKAHEALRMHLGINRIDVLIGGSMGGFQAMEWSISNPEIPQKMVLIATAARHSPWGIAFNETQRMAIQCDQTWQHPSPEAGLEGLKTARAIALLSYRHFDAYLESQLDEDNSKTDRFKAAGYQKYQGEKLAKRFNAFSYYTLTRAMDSHHVGRGRDSLASALNSIRAKTLVIGIETDLLFPIREQQLIAVTIPDAKLEIIKSQYGHDGFLVETDKISRLIHQSFS